MIVNGNLKRDIPIYLIIGSTRSGNTILSKVLNCHPRIYSCIEPYHIWDHSFRESSHDELDIADATNEVCSYIRKKFRQYLNAVDGDILIDKSPRNCLRLPFVKSVFPEARYIFHFRDGRDTIFEMVKRYEKHKNLFNQYKNDLDKFRKRFKLVWRRINRNDIWWFRIQSFMFEIGAPKYWLKKKTWQHVRWNGRFGLGPRFKGWEDIIDDVSLLEFCAYQWNHCLSNVLKNLPFIKKDMKLIMKYEEFVDNPEMILENLFTFMNVEFPDDFMNDIPEIWKGNYGLWRQAFSQDDLKQIGPIIGKTLIQLGYEKDEAWYLE